MSKPRLRMNPLVEKRMQISAVGTTVPIVGYLGPALQIERIRLYQDMRLTSYIELWREDIVDVVEAGSDKDPALVYVRREAYIEVHRVFTIGANWFQPKPDPPLYEYCGAFAGYDVFKPEPDPWRIERKP